MSILNPPMATPSPRKRSYAEADLDILAGLEEVVKKELPFEPNTPQVRISWRNRTRRMVSKTATSSILLLIDVLIYGPI